MSLVRVPDDTVMGKRSPTSDVVIRHHGREVQVRIKRHARIDHMRLSVRRETRTVTLLVPPHCGPDLALAYVDANVAWVFEHLETSPDPLPMGPGATVPLRGAPHLIVQGGSLRTGAWIIRPATIEVGASEPVPERCVMDLLVREARSDLTDACHAYAAKAGVSFARIVLRDQRARWGSCSWRGILSFSWRIAMAPPLALDYLAAHEVAHIRHPNHSKAYWEHLRAICGIVDEGETWFRLHSPALHAYGRPKGPVEARPRRPTRNDTDQDRGHQGQCP